MSHHHNRHECTLPLKDMSGLPKIPPNASSCKKWCRYLRKLSLVSSNHFLCNKLFRNMSAIVAERKRHVTNHAYVVHPLSRINTIVQSIFFFVWFYHIVITPVTVHCSIEQVRWLAKLDIRLLNVLKAICIVSCFNTGYIDWKTNNIVLQRRKIVIRYLTKFFLFDLLSIDVFTKIITVLHDDGIAFVDDTVSINMTYVFLFVRVVSLCTRISTVLRYLNYILLNIRLRKGFIIVLGYIVKTYIYIHMLGFMSYSIPRLYYNIYPFVDESWIIQANLTEDSGEVFKKYLDVLLFTGCYFFGVKHKFEVNVPIEQICMVVVTIFGRLYTLFLLADVLRLFGIAGISESMYEKQMVALNQYMQARDIPDDVTHRMHKYCEFKFQGRYFREDKIINTLSGNLRTELFLFTARKLVDKVKFFKKLPSSTLGDVIGSMKSEIYSPGDIIVKMGSTMEDIFFISTGTAAVMNDFGIELCHLEDGDEFGLGSFVMRDHTYCVVALETTEVFSIDKRELVTFLQPHREVMIAFYKDAKVRMEKWNELNEGAFAGNVDLLCELKSGHILEEFTRRVVGS